MSGLSTTPYYELPEWAGWLASIREQPDDDHRRLFCADWLDELETDEARHRAEFIRIQVELAKPQFRTLAGNPRLRLKKTARVRERLILLSYAARCAPGVEVVTSDKWRRTLGNTSAAVWFGRGFVTRVSSPLAVLNGGECECMRPTQLPAGLRFEPLYPSRGCKSCHGTGRTPGVLGELLRREPIAAAGIEVSDREPVDDPDSGFWWVVDSHDSRSAPIPTESLLPTEVFNWLTGYQVNTSHTRGYANRNAARLALGEALIRLHGPRAR